MNSSVAVLIPCYNESSTIGKVVRDFHEALPDADIYVYDNNSTDGTDEAARAAGAIVRYESRQGKGNVIRRMFREVNADCYLLVDGDDTYPACAAPEMAKLVLEDNVDMVIGDRLSSTYREENKRPFHNFGNALVRGTVNRLFNADIRDVMTGYRALSYAFAKSFPALSEGFETETEMTVHALEHDMPIANVVVDYRDRPAGSSSKLDTRSDGIKVLKTIAKLYKDNRPMGFFGGLAAVMMTVSAAMFIPILIKFMETGLVPNFPTLIVSGFIALAAIISFFAGMILSTIVEKDREAFALRLTQIENSKRYPA